MARPSKHKNASGGGSPKRAKTNAGKRASVSEQGGTECRGRSAVRKISRMRPQRGIYTEPGDDPELDDDLQGQIQDLEMDSPKGSPKPIKQAAGTKNATKAPKAALSDAEPSDVEAETLMAEDPMAETQDGTEEIKAAVMLDPEKVKAGNIIAYYHCEQFNTGAKVKQPATKKQADGQEIAKCEEYKLHCKFRKFIIIAVFPRHFVCLPIYSEKHDGAKNLSKTFWAEIEDKDQAAGHTKSKKKPWLMGSKSAKWLYSKPVHGQGQTTWGRMKRGCVIDMACPTSFQWNIKAKHVSDIFPEEDFKVIQNWHRDAMTIGKADTATIVLTPAEKEELKALKAALKAALKVSKMA